MAISSDLNRVSQPARGSGRGDRDSRLREELAAHVSHQGPYGRSGSNPGTRSTLHEWAADDSIPRDYKALAEKIHNQMSEEHHRQIHRFMDSPYDREACLKQHAYTLFRGYRQLRINMGRWGPSADAKNAATADSRA